MQSLKNRIYLMDRPLSCIINSFPSELEVTFLSISTILKFTSKLCHFFIWMFSYCYKTIITVENHSQTVNKTKITTGNITRKCLKAWVVQGKVTHKFCQRKIVIGNTDPNFFYVLQKHFMSLYSATIDDIPLIVSCSFFKDTHKVEFLKD